MTRLKLATALEPFGLPFRAALTLAAHSALDGVQFAPVNDLAPDQLSATGRRELRTLLRSHRLEFTALDCPLRRSLDNPEQLSARLDHLRKVALLAADLGCPRLILPLPALPVEAATSPANTLAEALTVLGALGDRTGIQMAFEPSADEPARVREFLKQFNVGSLRINFDTGTLALNGHNCTTAATDYRELIEHVQARDAVRPAASAAREVPAGDGNVDWVLLLATLESIGYTGTLTADANTAADRAATVRASLTYLRRFIPPPRV